MPVASVPMGLGGQLPPPHFAKVNKKSDIFISVYYANAVDRAEKSRRFSICPTFFLENDAPGEVSLTLAQTSVCRPENQHSDGEKCTQGSI